MTATLAAPVRLARDVKHSRFLALAAPVASAEAALGFLQDVADADATHNCWAYRIGDAYRSSDDGEPAGTAGRPILAAIDGQGFDRVMVVVTRWFGGVKLGAGGLVRAYGGTAAEALRTAQRRELVAEAEVVLACGFEDIAGVHAALAAFDDTKRRALQPWRRFAWSRGTASTPEGAPARRERDRVRFATEERRTARGGRYAEPRPRSQDARPNGPACPGRRHAPEGVLVAGWSPWRVDVIHLSLPSPSAGVDEGFDKAARSMPRRVPVMVTWRWAATPRASSRDASRERVVPTWQTVRHLGGLDQAFYERTRSGELVALTRYELLRRVVGSSMSVRAQHDEGGGALPVVRHRRGWQYTGSASAVRAAWCGRPATGPHLAAEKDASRPNALTARMGAIRTCRACPRAHERGRVRGGGATAVASARTASV